MPVHRCETCGTCEYWNGRDDIGVCELEFWAALDNYIERKAAQSEDALRLTAGWAMNWALAHVDDEARKACDRWEEAW